MDRRASRLVLPLLILGASLSMSTPLRAQSSKALPSSSPLAAASPTVSGSGESLRPLSQMSPGERQKWLENSKRWKNMTKEERQILRWQASLRAQRMEKLVDELIRKNGWNISPELRQQLLARYTEERRRIEDTLRKEMDEKRRPIVSEMVEKLKAEFGPIIASATPSPSPAASPAPSASPRETNPPSSSPKP